MIIQPYPAELVTTCELAEGGRVTLRPIRPEDAEIEQAFVRKLSPASRYFRFMGTLRELTPAMLMRFTHIDYDREMAFVAVTRESGREVEIAVARYITNADGVSCEFAIVVADAWQRRGLGRAMLRRLIDVARQRGLATMLGYIAANNRGMLTLCAQLGFIESAGDDTSTRRVALVLAAMILK